MCLQHRGRTSLTYYLTYQLYNYYLSTSLLLLQLNLKFVIFNCRPHNPSTVRPRHICQASTPSYICTLRKQTNTPNTNPDRVPYGRVFIVLKFINRFVLLIPTFISADTDGLNAISVFVCTLIKLDVNITTDLADLEDFEFRKKPECQTC